MTDVGFPEHENGLINVELLLMQQGIALHNDRLPGEFFHLLQPARIVRL